MYFICSARRIILGVKTYIFLYVCSCTFEISFLQDLTIQIDPHVTGSLKLPDLLDMMSRMIMERNYDAQIEDAFRCFDKERRASLYFFFIEYTCSPQIMKSNVNICFYIKSYDLKTL